MDGFNHVSLESNSPVYSLPEDWTDKNICLQWTAGIGDSLIALGAGAKALKSKRCRITVSCMKYQNNLVKQLRYIDNVIYSEKLNNILVRNSFDVIIDFAYCLNNNKEIKDGEYYTLAGNHLGLPLEPTTFLFKRADTPKFKNQESVFIHPGASNPNRRWDDSKWKEFAWEVRDRGFTVVWLGTKDEFGFSGAGVEKLSDTNEDLVWQAKKVAKSATYFVGCDSGFAHVCGLLNVPGVVLFFNTHPDNVIAKYKNLVGCHNFKTLGKMPTRSLDSGDLFSHKSRRLLTVEDVISKCTFLGKKTSSMSRKINPSKKLSIGAHGTTEDTDRVASFLAMNYDVEIIEHLPNNGYVFDALLVFKGNNSVEITAKNGVTAKVNSEHPENVRRAIREITGIKHGNS